MTSQRFATAIADLTRPGGGLDLGHDQGRMTIRMLHLLSQGQPVPHDRALDAIVEVGVERARAETLLDALTERDDDGAIVGLGLTYNRTAHEITIDAFTMWAWCAMDTLIFAVVLNKPVTVASTAPGSGQLVRLDASPSGIIGVDPPGAVITHPVRTRDQVDLSSMTTIWGTFCHHSFFFPSRTHAEEWAAGREDIEILALDEGFDVAVAEAAALMRYEQQVAR